MAGIILIVIYSVISLIALFFFALFILRMIRKRRKRKEIPLDILNDYEIAEKRYFESRGRLKPNEILWDIAKEKRGINFDNINERGQIENNGKTSNRQIANTTAWNFTEPKRTGSFAPTEQRIGVPKLPELPPRRQSFQNNFDTRTPAYPREPERAERNSNRGFLRRRK